MQAARLEECLMSESLWGFFPFIPVSFLSSCSSNNSLCSEFQVFIQSNKLSCQPLPWIQLRTLPILVPVFSVLGFQQQQTNYRLLKNNSSSLQIGLSVVLLATIPINQ